MRTPEEMLVEIVTHAMLGGGGNKKNIKQVLKELEEYYTLSDDELRELLPKKKNYSATYLFNLYDCDIEKVWEELKYRVGFNQAIDLTFKALQGRVPKQEVLSDKELMELLLQKNEHKDFLLDVILDKLGGSFADRIHNMITEEEYLKQFANAREKIIDLTFKALQGRVPRGLSYMEIETLDMFYIEYPKRKKEIEELKEEIANGDYWKKRATRYQENGSCPICFGDDEGGHNEGCYVLELEQRNAELVESVKPLAEALLPTKDLDKEDNEEVTCYFKVGILRRAKQALSKDKE